MVPHPDPQQHKERPQKGVTSQQNPAARSATADSATTAHGASEDRATEPERAADKAPALSRRTLENDPWLASALVRTLRSLF